MYSQRELVFKHSHRYYNDNEVKIGEKNARKKGTFRKIYTWHCEACPFTLKVHRNKIFANELGKKHQKPNCSKMMFT